MFYPALAFLHTKMKELYNFFYNFQLINLKLSTNDGIKDKNELLTKSLNCNITFANVIYNHASKLSLSELFTIGSLCIYGKSSRQICSSSTNLLYLFGYKVEISH